MQMCSDRIQKGDGPNFRKKRTVPLLHLKVIYGQKCAPFDNLAFPMVTIF